MVLYLLHSFNLSSRPYTAHRETDINGRSDTFVEQLCLQEDLSISDGDNVSGNVGRDISSL